MLKDRLLITGGTGFIGSALVRNAVAQNFEVALIQRDSKKIEGLFADVDSTMPVYPASSDGVAQAVVDFQPSSIIHLATCYGRGGESTDEIFSVNYDLPLRLVEKAIENNAQRFLNADTFFVPSLGLPTGLKAYVESKKEFLARAAMLTKKSETKFMNLKIFQAYGEGDRDDKFLPSLVKKLNESESIDLTSGQQMRDFIYVTDVASAFLRLCRFPPRIHQEMNFEVGTGVATSIRDVTIALKEMLGSKTKLNFGALPYRENEIMKSTADVESLISSGWKPKVSIEQGLEAMLASMKK